MTYHEQLRQMRKNRKRKDEIKEELQEDLDHIFGAIRELEDQAITLLELYTQKKYTELRNKIKEYNS